MIDLPRSFDLAGRFWARAVTSTARACGNGPPHRPCQPPGPYGAFNHRLDHAVAQLLLQQPEPHMAGQPPAAWTAPLRRTTAGATVTGWANTSGSPEANSDPAVSSAVTAPPGQITPAARTAIIPAGKPASASGNSSADGIAESTQDS